MSTQRLRLHSSAASIRSTLFLVITVLAFVPAVAVAGETTASTTIDFSVEEIAVMRVMGTLSRPLTLTAPTPATSPVTDSGTFIHYTSLVPQGSARVLTASIASGDLPSGCALRVEVVDLSHNDGWGTAVPGGAYLTRTTQSVITDIGSCATGAGNQDGVQISYTLVVEDEESLRAGETTRVTISFSLE